MSKYAGVKEVKEVSEVEEVNKLLKESWEILHICMAVMPYENPELPYESKATSLIQSDVLTLYVMGRK